MEYILLDRITIDRPIIFLCGPYYNKKNSSDRRLILQNFIWDTYNDKYLPLVIDDFLIKENIRDDKISIQLMEEICAAISIRTYIFLDTMSSATELGIFANSAFSNRITVFIPKKEDIYNRGNVGYFVKDVVLSEHPDKVEIIEYRPRVDRKVIATDFVTEHYSFVGDILPQDIINNIKNDEELKGKNSHKIYVEQKPEDTDEPFKIRFTLKDNTLTVHTSIRLLFYVTTSIVHCFYKENLSKKDTDFSVFDLDGIKRNVEHAFIRYISAQYLFSFDNVKEIVLSTVLKNDSRTLIYHIVKFVYVYYHYSSFDKTHLMTSPLNRVLQEDSYQLWINQIIHLSPKEADLLRTIGAKKVLFFEELSFKKGGKTRKIVKYRDDSNGRDARMLHDKIAKQLTLRYTPNPASYAYQKNKNIKLCVEKHASSRGFAKYDIKSFFNSISINRAQKEFENYFNISGGQKEQVTMIMNTCFWNNELPLGLIISPVISDIYLHRFDEVISNFAKEAGLVYTRYADDILISSPKVFTEEQFDELDRLVYLELMKSGLSINEKKARRINFDDSHSFVRYLGINLIKCDAGSYLSVGKKYIYDTAKEYLEYSDERNRFEDNRCGLNAVEAQKKDRELYYKHKEIVGKIGFIKQIEGSRGLNLLRKRLKKYFPDIELDALK